MKSFLRLTLCAVATAVLLAVPVRADAEDFDVVSFEAHYSLWRESEGVAFLGVREKIVAEFPDIDQNHGIVRAIPQSYKGHSLELHVLGVVDESAKAYPYETYTENDNLVLKIGDADTYVHGQVTYFIDYSMRGVISDANGHQEFYWDVNGDQWKQPFGQVKATVEVADDLRGAVQARTACYVGALDSKSTDCMASSGTVDKVTFQTNKALNPKETLTLVMAFDAGTFADYKPSAALIAQWVATGAAIAAPPLLALGLALRRWWRFGRDPNSKGVIVPEYLPPKDVTVLTGSAVLREGFQPKAISATIVDLAVRHYLKIYEKTEKKILSSKTTYELELVKEPSALHEHERKVLEMVFGNSLTVGQRADMAALEKTLYTAAQKVGESVNKQAATDDYFRTDPTKAKRPFWVWGTAIAIAGFFFPPWSLGLVGAGVILLLASFAMPARTQKGVELRYHLLGLEHYMKLAEAERLKVLQSPHGELTEKIDVGDKKQLVKVYERLLPYAMLFGIEKDWAKQFAGLYEQPPDWYAGSSTFNAAYFASAVHGFNSAATTSFTPPSSSSSSGFGGGGAGGGGGGGGGGGW
jgi:uncharacterized membrane protein YgcG